MSRHEITSAQAFDTPVAMPDRADVDDKASIHHDDLSTHEKGVDEPKVDRFGAAFEYSPEEKALVRKLDWYMIPILFVMYWLNKLDQNAIANARLNTFSKDLKLDNIDFNIAVSILYVGYTLIQVPSNLMISQGKVRPSLWMASWMMAWAVVSACTGAVQNFPQLVALRILLGFAEAPFYPGALYLLSRFYTRREIATRISILYSANMFASSFAGLISAGIFASLDQKYGIAGWRWLFIILGIVTFGVAIIGLFILPDLPQTTRWLTDSERQLAIDRIDRDTVGLEASRGILNGFKEALKDKKLWVFIPMQFLHLCGFGFASFFPTVVNTLGFSSTVSLLLTTPPYLVSGAFSVLLAWSSGRNNERTWHITAGMAVGVIGFSLAAATLNTAARYTACFLFASGAYSANSIIVGWVTATCGQTPEKKAAALAMVNMISMTSFIFTPYLYPASSGPQYLLAMCANAGFTFAVIVLAWVMRFWLQAENRKLQRSGQEGKLLYAY